MKKHHLYGRKTEGPWTSALNKGSQQVWDEVTLNDETSYAEGFMNGVENVTTAGVGSAAFVGGATYNGGKKAYTSAVEGVGNYNEWAQGLSDPETGIYPYTRNDDISGWENNDNGEDK